VWVRVARIGKPFGVRGQVTVQVFTDEPDARFTTGVELARSDAGADPVTVLSAQCMGTRWVLSFVGIDDRNAAEELRGTELFAPAVTAAGEDEWFDWQLRDQPCVDPTGSELGRVVAVEHLPAHDLLVVRTRTGQDVRVPFVSAIVPQVTGRAVVIDPPDGLFAAEGADGGID